MDYLRWCDSRNPGQHSSYLNCGIARTASSSELWLLLSKVSTDQQNCASIARRNILQSSNSVFDGIENSDTITPGFKAGNAFCGIFRAFGKVLRKEWFAIKADYGYRVPDISNHRIEERLKMLVILEMRRRTSACLNDDS